MPYVVADVNHGEKYEDLRNVYIALALAQWYKSSIISHMDIFRANLDLSNSTALKSMKPWSTNEIWDKYVYSFKNSEYKCWENETTKNTTVYLTKSRFRSSGCIDFGNIRANMVEIDKMPLEVQDQIKKAIIDGFIDEGKDVFFGNQAPCGFETRYPCFYTFLTDQHDNHISFEHLLRLMRLIYVAFIFLLGLITSAQCQQTAEDWYARGEALNSQGKYNEAIIALDESISLDPNLAAAWHEKSGALYNQSGYDEALQCLDKAIELITQVQNMPKSTAITESNNAASENNAFKILGIDSTAYPKVKASVFVDKFCAMAENLKQENFKVKEDINNVAIDNFYFSGNASGQKLDLAIVFDDTGSMDNELNALKSKVKDLTSKINSSKLDARYSLFTVNGDVVVTKINWTNDTEPFINTISKLSASGGDD